MISPARWWLFLVSAIVSMSGAALMAQTNGTAAPASPTSSAASAPSPADVQKAVDAANAVEKQAAKASDDLDKAKKYQTSINDICAPTTKSSQSALDDVQNLQATVQSVQTANLTNSLSKDLTDLNTAETARATACKALPNPAPADAAANVANTIDKCTSAGKDAADKVAALPTAQAGLNKALASVSPYMAKQFDDLLAKLSAFSDRGLIGNDGSLSKAPDAAVILQVLPKGLPAFRDVLDNSQQFASAWKSMQLIVQAASAANSGTSTAATTAKTPTETTPDAEQAKVQQTTDGIKSGIAGWLTNIGASLTAATDALDSQISGILSDPAKNSAAALGNVRDQSSTMSTAQTVADAVPPLIGFLEDGKPKGFTVKAVTDAEADLQTRVNVLRAAISRVHDALAGDFRGFETDQVSLYYFTDVARLMYVLNEGYITVGGVADAKAKADAQRTALTQTELELADAQATVNRYQKQVLDLQEQQRQAQATLKGLSANTSKLANRLKNAQDAKAQADENYKLAQDDQAAAPNDPTKKAEVDKAAADQTKAATKLSQAQSDYDSAKSDQSNAQSQADGTQNQSDTLPAKLAAAQQSLSDAQTAVSSERRKMLMAAQAESDAFAFARDNTPFMYAMADASSPNPSKRVMLYAFNDSKTIFMRGKRDDLAEVKKIINAFDQPAPQARLTLWTFELSAEAGQKANEQSAEKLNRSMQIIDEELSDTRALQNTTLDLLREVINDRVRNASTPWNPALTCPSCTQADRLKLNRLRFYDPLVLEQLNFETAGAIDVKRLRGEIPDPAGTTTLGEALVVLSLAPPAERNAIRSGFESLVLGRLRNLPLSRAVTNRIDLAAKPFCATDAPDQRCFLPLTWHALGVWESPPPDGLTSSQLEITQALRTSYEHARIPSILRELNASNREQPELDARLDQLRSKMIDVQNKALQKLSPADKSTLNALAADPLEPNAQRTKLVLQGLSPADQANYKQLYEQANDLIAQKKNLENDSVRDVNELQTFQIDVVSVLDLLSRIAASPGNAKDVEKIISEIKKWQPSATPREAAADEMLKELIIGLEDDLDRLFVQPMIIGLRERLVSDVGVSVGILQRESMLATNRGKARVDARASAQLAVGEEEDILAGVQQLAQLYGKIQAGGALAGLGALDELPREPQSEIYALTTGSNFEVTPVFDPSGQALRFKFDYVGTSNLQEPNGTTNPQFPKIERHTINTEVQLTNLETREISRFESDSRLGLPTRYSGGIPILKDIPYVRPWIPLIGWFVRKAGSNAVAQQSVIFGQTTIYPSILTMVSLLEDVESNPAILANEPESSTASPSQNVAQPPAAAPAASPEPATQTTPTVEKQSAAPTDKKSVPAANQNKASHGATKKQTGAAATERK